MGGREDALAAGSPGEQGKGHFRATFNVLKDVPAAKAALKHFTSFEFVVWCNVLCDTLTELAFAELVGQKSDSTFRDVDRMWRHARRVATNVKEKRYCRTTLQDMGTVLVCKDKGGRGALANPPPLPPPSNPPPSPPPAQKKPWHPGTPNISERDQPKHFLVPRRPLGFDCFTAFHVVCRGGGGLLPPTHPHPSFDCMALCISRREYGPLTVHHLRRGGMPRHVIPGVPQPNIQRVFLN